MAKNQNALKRYKVILKALSRQGKHSSNQIYIACQNSGLTCSYRTIQKDLEDLRDDFTIFDKDLKIHYDKSSKKWYSEGIPKEVFSALEFNEDEATALIFYAKTIKQYREYPIFKEISNAIKKVIESSNASDEVKELFENENLLETERYESISGVEFITDVLNSINKRLTLQIEYQKFDGDKVKIYEFNPVLLKEDKQMWYTIGKKKNKDRFITLALDRVKSLKITDENYTPINFNSEEYFKHSFGITVTPDNPQDVVISFTPEQGNYLRTLPIHSSQEVLIDNEIEFKIKLTVIPSYEFYSKIRSYGEQAKIISPKHIVERIKASFSNALNNYKSN